MNNRTSSKIPILIYGSGGISIEAASLIEAINKHNHGTIYQIIGFIEKDSELINKKINKYSIVASDSTLETFLEGFPLVGLVVPIGTPKVKINIIKNLRGLNNLYFPNLIHPSASLDGNITMGVGNIITAGCRFTTQISIGNFNLFNLNVTVGHEVIVGDYCVLNPGATVSGGVVLNDAILVGTGANILQYIHIEDYAILGGGALINKNVSTGQTIVGVPGKPLG